MINAIIVDDEPHSAQALGTMIKTYCPEINIVSTCNDPREALEEINKRKPELLFLDIAMPHMNGFQLIEKLAPVDLEIIFTTSHNQFAIKAIRFSAFDYLLKPIDAVELRAAVDRYLTKNTKMFPQQLQILLSHLSRSTALPNKIALPAMEGIQMVSVDSIIYCSSSSNYTTFTIKGNQKITVSKTLREIENMLEDYSFIRVHQSYLVNFNEVQKYIRGEGGQLKMSDGSLVDVSRSRKDALLKRLQSGK